MADSSDRILKILLQLKADTAPAVAQVKSGLQEVEAQATKTAAAVTASGGTTASLAVRQRALELQQKHNTSAEFALRIAQRQIAAEEAIVAARVQASTVLATNNTAAASSAERLAGSTRNIGTGIFIAAGLAYKIYEGIAAAADEAVRLAKEVEKETSALEKSATIWFEMAKAAGDFGDVVKIGENIQPQLETLAAKLAEFRANELSLWQRFGDLITRQFSAIPGYGPSFNKDQRDQAIGGLEQANRIALLAGNASIDAAQKAKAAWEAVNLLPLNEAVEEYTRKLDDLKAKQSGIDRTAGVGEFNEWVKINKEIELTSKRLDDLTKTQTKLSTEAAKTAAGFQKVDLSQLDKSGQLEALNAQLFEIQENLQKVGVDAASPEEALAKQSELTKEAAEEVIKLAAAWKTVLGEIAKVTTSQEEDNRRAAQRAENDALRERAQLMRQIQQEQRAVADDPFLSIADKNARLIPLLLEEAAAHEKAGDAAEAHARKMEALALTFSGDLRSNIVAWANSFGTSAQQIGGFITGSINEALSATNQLITDAVFRTGDWQSVVVGLEKSILNMFLTMIEKMILQHVIGETQKGVSTATSVAQGGAVAAAQAPAAAATSISSFGTSAVVGSALAIAAIGAIIAALGGGFARGGRTGSGPRLTTVGEEGEEFVFTNRATRNIGISNLYAMMHAAESAPHFDDGGFVEPGPLPGTGGNWHDPRIGPVPYYPHYPYVGDYGVSPRLYPGGGDYNPFAPGGGHHSGFEPYDPFAGANAGGSPGTSNPFAPGGGFHSSFVRRPDVVAAMERLGHGTIDPVTGDYVSASGQVIASYDPSTGAYVTPSGEVVAAANPRGVGGPGSVRGGYVPPRQSYVNAVLRAFPSLNNPASIRALQAGARPSALLGRNQFDSHAANLSLMANMAQHDPVNFAGARRAHSDEGMTNNHPFSSNMMLIRDSEGGFSQVPFHRDRSSNPALQAWAAAHTSTAQLYGAPRRAAGGLLPGAPSTEDTMLAWLAGGEFVMKSAAVAKYGPDLMSRLNNLSIPVSTPHFADGGAVGRPSSSSGSRSSSQRPVVNIAYFDDPKKALKWLDSQEGEQILVDVVNRSRHVLGMGATN